MRIGDILEHFLAHSPWIDRGNTVDRIIEGDAGTDVSHCTVTWMPTMAAIEETARRGIRLMICHEPTYWNHRDVLSEDPAILAKRELIHSRGISIIRNHDCWDRFPEIGIPWAWAQSLGITSRPVQIGRAGYQHRYDIPAISAGQLADQVARACAASGEEAVQLTGPRDQVVSRIGVGTGCCCDIRTFIDMGCDCSIVCDDGSCYWSEIQRAKEIGHPVIRVNHGTSEEPGMVTLTRYINTQMPGLAAEHLPHGNTFRLSFRSEVARCAGENRR